MTPESDICWLSEIHLKDDQDEQRFCFMEAQRVHAMDAMAAGEWPHHTASRRDPPRMASSRRLERWWITSMEARAVRTFRITGTDMGFLAFVRNGTGWYRVR